MRCLNDTKSIMGHLTPIESGIDVPFEIKRIYYITNVPFGVERGYHAHKKLQQVLICLNGSVKILIDGFERKGNRGTVGADKRLIYRTVCLAYHV